MRLNAASWLPPWIVGALAIGLGVLSVAGGALASVSIAVTWDGLLQASTEAIVATPTEARSAWERDRIYTYTHIHVDRAIAGQLAKGSDAWVRTMGGIVGDTGQRVEGEPELVQGATSLLFLQPGPNGTYHVTARAQGQFPVVPTSGTRVAYVVRSTAVGALVRSQSQAAAGPVVLASDALHGRTVDDAALEVVSAWSRTHAH